MNPTRPQMSKPHREWLPVKKMWLLLGLMVIALALCAAECQFAPYYDPPKTSQATTQVVKSTSQGRAAAIRLDDYYLWQTAVLYGVPDRTMTAELCQDDMNLLQSGRTFIALRVPVYSSTLPVCFDDGYAPYLNLLDERAFPAVPVLTTSLEYKPQYLTFAENELPAAPGEHWLALGAVTSPAIDCAALPALPTDEWEFQTNVWLDFGGAHDAGRGATLPLYYCYEGQSPPGADTTSYQGWGITCLGPHYLTLRDGPDDWELAGQGMGWVTPTQTISFSHTIYNWTPYPHPPLTFTLEATSTLPAGWAFYADEQGQTPLVSPIRVDDVLEFWVFGQAPAGTAAGAYNLFVTARTDDALPAWQQAADLLWVGDWVAPPLPPWWHRLYLPLVLRS
ncbi:MAG: hypothetical protein KKA73_08890 [Chloroflexi bacterium]|nr:hypothetical protein [Chloroflexota bacterium]MBU1747793.1 hypothetical protein [Chloroflexota bacterium]